MQLSLISLALTRIYGGEAAFDPLSLFASGEQGAWYDPSDLSTLFQDSAGTTPVTADGQPVGLILDKSKGLVLGPELCGNGDFDSAAGWTLGSGWNISGGKLVASSAVATNARYAYSGVVSWYQLTITIDSVTTSDVTFRLTNAGGGNVTQFSTYWNSPGTRTYFVSTNNPWANIEVSAGGGAGFSGVIDNISVKELAGNHAYQATTAKKPLYKTSGGLHWLQFDGVDDALSTASIDFTSTDKMSWFHGGAINNTSLGLVVELSETANVNPGTFNCYYNDAGYGGLVGRAHKAGSNTGPPEVAVAIPNTSVYALSTDFTNIIGGKAVYVRRNGAAYANGGSHPTGVATFGNYQMYIGARAGTSLYLNGNIYSLIILGRLATTQEITDTEQWVATKTGVTL